MARKPPQSAIEFTSASQRAVQTQQELEEARQRIKELVTQIEQQDSRGVNSPQMSDLKNMLAGRGMDYPVSKLKPNPEQTRKTFAKEIKKMAYSLEKLGQIDDVMVFDDGSDIIFDGETRWRGAIELGWETIRIVYIPRPAPKENRRRNYVTNQIRENLNKLDKAEALIQIITDQYPNINEDIPRLINRVLVRLKRYNKQVRASGAGETISISNFEASDELLDNLYSLSIIDTEQERRVFSILLDLQENPSNLERHIFPILGIPEELKDAIRKGFDCESALALAKLSAHRLEISEREAKKLRLEGIKLFMSSPTTEVIRWVEEHLKESSSQTDSNEKVTKLLRSLQKVNFHSLSLDEKQKVKIQLLDILEKIESLG